MSKKYLVKKLYVVKLATATKIIEATLYKDGKTCRHNMDGLYIAQPVLKDDETHYKILSKDIVVYGNHNQTHNVGDIFVVFKRPLAFMKLDKKHSKKLDLNFIKGFEEFSRLSKEERDNLLNKESKGGKQINEQNI